MGKIVEDPLIYREENTKIPDEEIQLEKIEKDLE